MKCRITYDCNGQAETHVFENVGASELTVTVQVPEGVVVIDVVGKFFAVVPRHSFKEAVLY